MNRKILDTIYAHLESENDKLYTQALRQKTEKGARGHNAMMDKASGYQQARMDFLTIVQELAENGTL
jgi:hypothetical protein